MSTFLAAYQTALAAAFLYVTLSSRSVGSEKAVGLVFGALCALSAFHLF